MMLREPAGWLHIGMAHFTKLLVWEKSHALMVNTHRVVKGMKRAYDKSLSSQMNRAAESIAANIVEGRGKPSDAEFARFLRIALGSAHELEYHFMAARDVDAITRTAAMDLISQVIEVRRMIYGLLRRLDQDGR
ncbi:MAG TPA: four helix bundle protein [Gemmatimonadaceae bacterium]|nr:four helix bundle protein [Gemmatimonadaceae bacterium]